MNADPREPCHQLIDYLDGQPDAVAKLLQDQLRYCLELHREAFSHPESTGVYKIDSIPSLLYSPDRQSSP